MNIVRWICSGLLLVAVGCNPSPSPTPVPAPLPAVHRGATPDADDLPQPKVHKQRKAIQLLPEPRTPEQLAIDACSGVDGWHCSTPKPLIRAALGGVRPPIVPASWTVSAWFLDPANSSGTAADTNNCTTSATACINPSEIEARWGTNQPVLRSPTNYITITVISSQSDTQMDKEAIAWEPRLSFGNNVGVSGSSGMILRITGTALTTASATIGSVTAKDPTVPVQLKVTLSSGTFVQFGLIQNTTHPSFSIAEQGGTTNVQVGQPVLMASAPVFAPPYGVTEVNTWATSDSLTLTTLPRLAIAWIKPKVQMKGEAEVGNVQIDNLVIASPTTSGVEDPGDSSVAIGQNVELINGSSLRLVQVDGNTSKNGQNSVLGGSQNWIYQGGFQGGFRGTFADPTDLAGQVFAWNIFGGDIEPGTGGGEETVFDGVYIDADARTIHGTTVTFNNINYIGSYQCDGSAIVNSGTLDVQNLHIVTGANLFWGRGSLDSGRGTVYYPAGATAGATVFPDSFPLLSAGLNLACLINPAALTTTDICNKGITGGPSLDSSLGTTVVGCLAIGVSGFCNTPL